MELPKIQDYINTAALYALAETAGKKIGQFLTGVQQTVHNCALAAIAECYHFNADAKAHGYTATFQAYGLAGCRLGRDQAYSTFQSAQKTAAFYAKEASVYMKSVNPLPDFNFIQADLFDTHQRTSHPAAIEDFQPLIVY